MILRVRVSAVSQNRVVDQWWVVKALHIELSCILVCVAGVGAGRRLGAGGSRGMSVGWGGHVVEGGKPGVYTHPSARYGVHG